MKDTESCREEERDDIELALPALKRAAQVARERARRNAKGVIVWRDGRIVEEFVPAPSGERQLEPWDSWFEGPSVSEDFMAARDQLVDKERGSS
jgi:hypothetical protein